MRNSNKMFLLRSSPAGAVQLFGTNISTSFGVSSTQRSGLVDGNMALSSYSNAPNTVVTANSQTVWVRVTLLTLTPINRIAFWNYYDGRTYCNISLSVSSTCLFAGEQTTLFSCTSFSSCPTAGPTLTSTGYTVSFQAIMNALCVQWTMGLSSISRGVEFLELSLGSVPGTQCH